MTRTLDGKVVAITGASKGMGRAFATLLAANGARIVALARASDALDSLALELSNKALAIPCDITDPQAITAAMDQAAQRFGRIDALVNNAASVAVLKVEHATDADIQQQYATNMFGSIYATRAAIPHLRAAGGGDIVFMSSESVRMPFPTLTLYVSSKAAVEGLALGLRQELRADGTRVTVLRSGAVDTKSVSADWSDEKLDSFMREAKRLGCLDFSGTYATPGSMAEALFSVLALPRDVNVDLIEVRARAPLPE